MKVELDRKTLPEDNQYVRFKGYSDDWILGVFVESDMTFVTKEGVPYCAWIVYEWEPI